MTFKKNPDIANLIQQELNRQQNGLEMIASENFVSIPILKAMGSILTNKYSEGYPNKRYYSGNEYIDQIEKLAIKRAKQLFKVSHANVQPYSGSPANHAALFAVAKPNDKIMGLNLLYGGHLTHGWKINFSAKFYNSIQYKTDSNGFIDYNYLRDLAKKEKPKVIFSGSTAYPRIYDYKKIAEIARSVNAFYIADIAHECGFIAAGLINSPVGHADIITTTTHKTLRGPRGAIIMCNGNQSNPLKNVTISKENLPTLIDRAVFPGLQGGPHNHITAGIAIALKEASTAAYKKYMQNTRLNAQILANTLLENDFNLITGGTDNHLLVIDLRNKKLTGKDAEKLLQEINITINKNTIPNEPNSPFDPSGIRLGTPALTTRGFDKNDFKAIGQIIASTLNDPQNLNIKNKNKKKVKELTDKHPIYNQLKYI
jgi:glycine hydroxymethyltransferase